MTLYIADTDSAVKEATNKKEYPPPPVGEGGSGLYESWTYYKCLIF
jgi:hypothetical protein